MIIKLISNKKNESKKHLPAEGNLSINQVVKFDDVDSSFRYSFLRNPVNENLITKDYNYSSGKNLIDFNANFEKFENNNALLKQKLPQKLNNSSVKSADSHELLANVSHELRTPLNAIEGLCNLLEKTQLTLEQTDYLESLRITSTNMLSMVNNVLSHSKLVSGHDTIELNEVDIIDLVQNVRRTLQQEAAIKNLSFTCDFDFQLPRFIKTDASKLTQVLMNLLSNAIKFTAKGGVSLHIGYKANTYNNLLSIVVSDTGKGIEKSDFDVIFERYNQSGANNYVGTGLGLAIVKSIIKLLKGKITLESEMRKGSIFRVDIPLEKAKDTSVYDSLDTKKVVVVEDNLLNQKIIARLLINSNYKLIFRNNGHEAFDYLSKYKVDAVLMDLQLPDIDGFEVNRLIRTTLNSNTAIIGFTACMLSDVLEKCIENGFLDCIHKNFDLQKISNVLDQNTSFQALDLSYLNAISSGDIEFEKEIVAEALIQIPADLLQLAQDIRIMDTIAISNLGHKLCSSFSVIGFMFNSNFEKLGNAQNYNKTELLQVFSSLKMHYINYESLIKIKYNPI